VLAQLLPHERGTWLNDEPVMQALGLLAEQVG